MKLYPNAKINIGLCVVEKRPDGYHNLETVFYPIGVHDELDIEIVEAPLSPTDSSPLMGSGLRTKSMGGECELTISGVEIAGDLSDNLICRAYRLLAADHELPSVRVHLQKNIPTGAGLGGGSADAAYMLRGMNEIAGLNLSEEYLETIAAKLGADCAVFIKNKPVYATGIGNIFHPISMISLSGYQLVLVKPDVFVSTKDAYSLVKPKPTTEKLTDLLSCPIETWKAQVVNDFEQSVFAKFPLISEVKDKLYGLGADYACMSGSGASVFALFAKPLYNLDSYFPGMFTYSEIL